MRVRMGLHTGEPAVGDEGYIGLDVVRAARICSAGHGGQVLLSETTRALVGGDLPAGRVGARPRRAEAQGRPRRAHLPARASDGSPTYFPMLRTEGSSSDFGERINKHVESMVEAQLNSVFAGGKPPTVKLAGLTAFGLITLFVFLGVLVGHRLPDQGGVLLDGLRPARRRPRRRRHHLVRRPDLHAAARRARAPTWSRSSRRGRRGARRGGLRSPATSGRCSSRRTRASGRSRSTSAAAQRSCSRLVDRADVFVQSLRPGLADELGLGADALQNPAARARPLHDLVVRRHRAEAVAPGLRPAAPGGRRPDQRHRRARRQRRPGRRLADRPRHRHVRGVRDPRRAARGRRPDARRLALGDGALVRLLPPDRHDRDRVAVPAPQGTALPRDRAVPGLPRGGRGADDHRRERRALPQAGRGDRAAGACRRPAVRDQPRPGGQPGRARRGAVGAAARATTRGLAGAAGGGGRPRGPGAGPRRGRGRPADAKRSGSSSASAATRPSARPSPPTASGPRTPRRRRRSASTRPRCWPRRATRPTRSPPWPKRTSSAWRRSTVQRRTRGGTIVPAISCCRIRSTAATSLSAPSG